MEGGKGKTLLLPVRYYGRHTDVSGQVSCLELAGRGVFLVGSLHHRPADVMVEIGVGGSMSSSTTSFSFLLPRRSHPHLAYVIPFIALANA
jgi:hypothetical protein